MCGWSFAHGLGKNKKRIITYSVALISRYIIEKLRIHPSSGNNIMVHCQLNGQETVANLSAVMQFRFNYHTHNNLPMYDLGDAKLIYLILQHSHWQCLYHAFLLCGCLKGASVLEGSTCTMWMKEQYISYVKKSEDQWARRDLPFTSLH